MNVSSKADIVFRAGRRTYPLPYAAAELLASNLRAFPKLADDSVSAADKIEAALVGEVGAVELADVERIAVVDVLDVLHGGPFNTAKLRALFKALNSPLLAP